MFAQFAHDPIENQSHKSALPASTLVAVLLGLGLGALFTLLWPHLTGLVALAAWPLGLSITTLAVGLLNFRWSGEPSWGLVIGGQVLGVTAVSLLLLSRLI